MNARPEEPRATRAFWIGLAAIVALAIGLRTAVVVQYEAHHPMAGHPQVDEGSYDRWAQRIAGGDWIGDEVFFQEPGYAYGLAAVYAAGPLETRTSRAHRVQVVLGGLGVLLVGWLGGRLFGPWSGLLAALALALHRPALLAPCLLLKVNVALPIVLGLALVLERGRRRGWPAGTSLALGALAGLGALLRGNLLVLIPALALWPCVRRVAWTERLRAGALVVLGAFLALSPALVRNYVVGGRFVVTSGAGTNVFGGNNAENPYGVATEFDWIRAIPEHEPDDWRREAERRVGHDLDPIEVSSFWLGETLRSMLADPGLHARIFWNKLRLVFNAYEVPDNHHLDWDARFVPLLRVPTGGFGVWGVLGLAGMLAFLVHRRPTAAWDPLVLFVLYAGTIVLTVMSMRARLAIVPLMLPYAGRFVVELVRAHGEGALRRRASLALLLLVAAGVVHAPFFTAEERQLDFDERDFNLAVHLLRDGEPTGAALDDVERIANRLAQRYPHAPRVVVLQADLEYRRARALLDRPDASRAERQRGAELVERALERLASFDRAGANAHELFRADYLSGAILQYQGRFDLAVRAFRSARRFDDDDRDVRRRLAVCLANAAVTLAEPERSAGLREALELYDDLIAEAPEPELARLRAQVDAALRAGSSE